MGKRYVRGNYICPVCGQRVDFPTLRGVIMAMPKDVNLMRVFVRVRGTCGHMPTVSSVYAVAARKAEAKQG